MPWPLLRLLLLPLLSFTAASAADEGIRSFPIPTLEALGKELYVRDHMVALASDALFAAFPKAGELHLKGWISQVDKDTRRVFFIREQDSQFVLAFTVTFQRQGPPKVEDAQGAPLPDAVAKRYAARLSAIKAVPKFFTETYNFEVLDDPDGPGFLVYALAATKDPDEVVVGGHYRISVSADGTKVTRVDALSRSFLVIRNAPPTVPQGTHTQVVAAVVSHIVSNTPVETHVYLSLLHKRPIYVTIPPDNDLWQVKDGNITKDKGPPKLPDFPHPIRK